METRSRATPARLRSDAKVPRLTGMVHLQPLPGSPLYGGTIDAVVDAAVADAQVLCDGGFDAIIVENFGDVPFVTGRVGPETVAAMTFVAGAIKNVVGIHVGINVLRNDPLAALAIAAVIGGTFIRVNVHTGVVVADQGVIQGDARATLAARRLLGADVSLWADVHVKHARPLVQTAIEDEAADAVERGCADAIIVSGPRTGSACDLRELARVRSSVDAPVLVGSGVNEQSVAEILTLSDGVIVGSCLKRAGRVDRELVDRIVARSRG